MQLVRAFLALCFLAHSSAAHALCAALTFDDGPHANYTQSILTALKNSGAVATFFVVGRWVEQYPHIVQQIAHDGHEVGSHMYRHNRLDHMSSAGVSSMITQNDALLRKVAGRDPQVLRAPYFGESEAVRNNPAARGRPFVQADVDSLDYRGLSASAIASRVVNNVQNGSIVLLHDIHGRTAQAVPAILAGLKQKGYQFVTVSQLLSSRCGEIRARVRHAVLH